MAQVENIKSFKGRDISKKTKGVRDEIRAEIEEWKNLDPAEFHTAGGLDALKQQIGEMWDCDPIRHARAQGCGAGLQQHQEDDRRG